MSARRVGCKVLRILSAKASVRVSAEADPSKIIRPGDRVLFEADDQHDVVHWLEPVSETEYAAAPPPAHNGG